MYKTLLILLFPLTIIGQIINIKSPAFTVERGDFSNIGKGTLSTINYEDSPSVKGHKYYANHWLKGTLIINDTIYSEKRKVQFNMVNGRVMIPAEDDDSKGFDILDHDLTGFILYEDDNKQGFSLFVRKENSDFVENVNRHYFYLPFPKDKKQYIIVDLRKKLVEPKISKNHYTTVSYDNRYLEEKQYYVLNKQGKYIPIKLKKKSILKTLTDFDKHKISSYIKSKNLNMKDLNDLHKLIKYCHSI